MIEWFSNNPAAVATVFTILGGILLKVVESWLHKNQEYIASKKDYREEIAELRERVDSLEAEIERWRKVSHHLEEELTKARVQLVKLGVDPPPRDLPL